MPMCQPMIGQPLMGQPMGLPMSFPPGMPIQMLPPGMGAPVSNQTSGKSSGPGPKVKRMQTYAAEIECSESETRHWMHRWCIDQNGGKLATIPPILQVFSNAPCSAIMRVNKAVDAE